MKNTMKKMLDLSLLENQVAECRGFSDKHLDKMVAKVQDGVDKLVAKYPGMQRVKISSGLRGTRYYIEFPIVSKNFDAFSLLMDT